jgi:hypothetical protein
MMWPWWMVIVGWNIDHKTLKLLGDGPA